MVPLFYADKYFISLLWYRSYLVVITLFLDRVKHHLKTFCSTILVPVVIYT
jgi:hypothetical protein